jgi:N6-adenosine-specific RNA methylase IME4
VSTTLPAAPLAAVIDRILQRALISEGYASTTRTRVYAEVGVHPRRLWGWRSGECRTVGFSVADRILTRTQYLWFDVWPECTAHPEPLFGCPDCLAHYTARKAFTGLLIPRAILAVQGEAPTLKKDKTNPHFKSKYTPLDTIVETIGPILHKHGLVWMTLPGTDERGEPALSYRLAHAATGEVLEGTMSLLLSKNDAQGMGSAITYARRYALTAVLNLVSDDDDDGACATTSAPSVSRSRRRRTPCPSSKRSPRFRRARCSSGCASLTCPVPRRASSFTRPRASSTSRTRSHEANEPLPHHRRGPAVAVRGRLQRLGRPQGVAVPPMELDAIRALPVADMLEREGYLFLWATNRHLEAAYTVARAWGCTPRQTLTWCKPIDGTKGLGGMFVTNTEFVVVAQKIREGTNAHGARTNQDRAETSWFEWPKQPHSQKPEAFLDLVERVSPGPYLEMFARRARFGWDYWGDQSLGTRRWSRDARADPRRAQRPARPRRPLPPTRRHPS